VGWSALAEGHGREGQCAEMSVSSPIPLGLIALIGFIVLAAIVGVIWLVVANRRPRQ